MTFRVRTVSGSWLVVGNVDTCLVAVAELSQDSHARRYWYWANSKSQFPAKLFPDESFVPAKWYKAGKTKHCANMARLQKTDGAIQLVVFSEDALLLNADGRVVMRY